MQRGCEALAAMVSEAEPPTLPPAAKRRRTGMDGGSVAHLRVVWQVRSEVDRRMCRLTDCSLLLHT